MRLSGIGDNRKKIAYFVQRHAVSLIMEKHAKPFLFFIQICIKIEKKFSSKNINTAYAYSPAALTFSKIRDDKVILKNSL